MPTFDIDQTEITAFEIDDTILFKHYFDQQDAFYELKDYYNNDKYRFEIPEEGLELIQQILDKYHCTLQLVDDHEPYCVVVQKGDDYTDILKTAVLTKERSGHLIFLLKDELSVEQALEHGAARLSNAQINEEI